MYKPAYPEPFLLSLAKKSKAPVAAVVVEDVVDAVLKPPNPAKTLGALPS